MDDLISRQAALDAMETWDKFGCDPDGKLVRYDDDKHYIPYVHYEDMVHAIKHLPSAQPERKKGKWIKHEHGFWTFVNKQGERDGWIPDYECSECGSRGWKELDIKNYCPNCGADMRGEQDE